MSARTLFLALAQAAALWAVGAAVVALIRRRMNLDLEGAATTALLALPASVLVAVVLMVVHALSGGRVFSNPVVVPVVLGAVVALAVRAGARPTLALDRSPGARGRRWIVAALGLVLILLYVGPAVQAGSSARTGDPPWHLGWTEQVLDGRPLPVGPAPEFARNAYPWGYHAVLATMVRAVPSSDPLVAHEAIHLVLVIALPLAAAALARVVDRRAALPAAIAMSLAGGWGWIQAREPVFFPRPLYAPRADPAVGSPNAVYEMFPPAMPRELGLVLLAAAGLLLVRALTLRSRASFAGAGAAVGLAGLVSLPMFVGGLAWMAAILWSARGHRARAALWMFGAAGAVLALWAAPVAWNYVDHGGFVRVSPRLGREWPLVHAVGSWGLLAPAAAVGAVLCFRRSGAPRAIFGFVAATAILLALTVARGAYDWHLMGQATLFHQGRVWPVAHLLGSVLTGGAVVWAWQRGRRVSAAAATAALLGALTAVAVTSPILASARLGGFMEERRFGFVYSDPEIRERTSFLRRAAGRMAADDLLLVEGSDELAFFAFQFSGVRLATYDDPGLAGNDLRIRYRDLAAAWDARMRSSGFGPPDFLLRSAAAPAPPGRPILEEGIFRGQAWALYGP